LTLTGREKVGRVGSEEGERKYKKRI